MIMLSEILEMSAFKDFKILAGENGINRTVTSVSVMDAPDIDKWLKGGEILITTGYIMRDNISEFLYLIKNIDGVKAAALFIKMKRFIDKLPEDVLDLANSLGFPIVSVPMNFAFTDVINPVLSVIINEQARRLQLSENIHKSFTYLVLKGATTKEIVETLSKIIKCNVAYLDTYYNKKYVFSSKKDFTDDILNYGFDELILKYKNYPIRIDNRNYGYIICLKDHLRTSIDEYIDIAIEHAGTVLKLEVQKRISYEEIKNRQENEFVHELITEKVKNKDDDELKSKAMFYNLKFENKTIVISISVDDLGKLMHSKRNQSVKLFENIRERIFEICKKHIYHNFKSSIFANLGNNIVSLIQLEDGENKIYSKALFKVCNEIKENIKKNYKVTLTIGIGELKDSIKEAYISYKEAKHAVKLGRILYKKNKIVLYKDLGVYRLLDAIYDTKEARQFCESSIGKLKQHDKRFKSDLVNTLITIKECDWNLKEAAEKMYIHYNTMKYRYKKIEEILNADLSNSEERFVISITIKLMRMDD